MGHYIKQHITNVCSGAKEDSDGDCAGYDIGRAHGDGANYDIGTASHGCAPEVHIIPVQNPYYGEDDGILSPLPDGRLQETQIITRTNNIYYE